MLTKSRACAGPRKAQRMRMLRSLRIGIMFCQLSVPSSVFREFSQVLSLSTSPRLRLGKPSEEPEQTIRSHRNRSSRNRNYFEAGQTIRSHRNRSYRNRGHRKRSHRKRKKILFGWWRWYAMDRLAWTAAPAQEIVLLGQPWLYLSNESAKQLIFWPFGRCWPKIIPSHMQNCTQMGPPWLDMS